MALLLKWGANIPGGGDSQAYGPCGIAQNVMWKVEAPSCSSWRTTSMRKLETPAAWKAVVSAPA
ncbi:hypothetical protein [Archangium violaceum]|uniref:Uncharacterized protein n=1 Tax=Archangium violaceum Cb vi76 TaxID=1406225 RepID=A0A084SR82_9BACT|nr:hypothetical protein [Archangium violaceum]KFA90967.1 hypothetical protein Q664_24910 [Archangium violaceum Cb vi76]